MSSTLTASPKRRAQRVAGHGPVAQRRKPIEDRVARHQPQHGWPFVLEVGVGGAAYAGAAISVLPPRVGTWRQT